MLELTGLQQEIFKQRYAFTPEETWEECAKRVAQYVASAEEPDKVGIWFDEFEKMIVNGYFMPGGRILFGSGRRNFNKLNCYALECEDNVQSIGKLISDVYRISCSGGGIGIAFSKIRPKGDDIQNIRNSAPGSVSVMKMVNEIGNHVRAGKNRRTALLACLNVDHPDLLEFLRVKMDLKELNNFNISVGITDKFIEAVKKNEIWTFKFNNRDYQCYRAKMQRYNTEIEEIIITATSKQDAINRAEMSEKKDFRDVILSVEYIPTYAKDIYNKIVEYSWKVGDPGFLNLSLLNSLTNVNYFEIMNTTNPCGEIGLPAYSNCCLGHVNLNEMFDADTNNVNWKLLAKTIRIGIRFLDNVISINHYPLSECKTAGERSRRIGLGVTGLHYLLIQLGLQYGSEKSLEFLDRLFSTIRDEAYKASVELAKEKGAFSAFDAEKYSKEGFFKTLPPRIQTLIKKYGIRNAVMLTIAPCGTNSMVLGVSTGIEPIFAPLYERTYRENNVWKTQLVADKLFMEYWKDGKDTSIFCGAHDLTPREHISVQATIQRYIDSSISKTNNIPEDYPIENLADDILEFLPYVKGFTIYRTNSRGMEPLKPVKLTSSNLESIMNSLIGTSTQSADSCKSGLCEV